MKTNLRATLFISFCLLSFSLMAGCASLNVLSSYPRQANSWKQALEKGNDQQALDYFTQKKGGHNKLLYSLEAGRIAQIMGDNKASKHWFSKAEDTFEAEDNAARVRLSGLAETGVSLITNDRALSYRGAPYERIFSDTFQALNYLALGDDSGAAVEFRRVDHTQRQQVLKHQKAIAKAENNAKDDAVDIDKYQGYFEGLNGAAALVRSGIENAYSYYLTAVFWEGRGDYNDALVDYKQALQILPNADFLKADIQRVSGKLDGKVSRKKGLLVVALEQGFVQAKQPLNIPIPTVQGQVMISFPVYQLKGLRHPVPVRVRSGGQYATTHPMARVGAIAAHALKEKIPGMLTRQILRVTAKYSMQKEVNRRSSPLGSFITQIYNIISEQADLRSWLSLPANAQIARMNLPAGQQTVELAISGRNIEKTINIPPAGVTLVRVIQIGNKVTTRVMTIHNNGD